MSFITVLKTIGSLFTRVANVVTPLEPIIAAVPGGAAFNVIFNAVVNIEQAFVGVAKAGPAKTAAVQAIVNSQIAIDPLTLTTAINSVVSALNTLQATHDLTQAKP